MEVILLERVGRLGHMGDVVRVKDGFARNFLLPKGKALRATKENRQKFEGMKAELEKRNVEQRGDAESIGKTLGGKSFVVLRQASEAGQLYGSVSGRDISALLNEAGFAGVARGQVALHAPIKSIGLHQVPIALHPEVEVTITINVARSADEADRIARGEDVISRREEAEEAEAETIAPEAFFEKPQAGAEDEEQGEAKEEASQADKTKGAREAKGAKDAKETKEPKASKETKAAKETKGAKGAQDDEADTEPKQKKARKARDDKE
jgi:large subunit ribosomal protein L9